MNNFPRLLKKVLFYENLHTYDIWRRSKGLKGLQLHNSIACMQIIFACTLACWPKQHVLMFVPTRRRMRSIALFGYDSIICAEIFEGFWSANVLQQNSQMEFFNVFRTYCVHSGDDWVGIFSFVPMAIFPNIMNGNIAITVFSRILIVYIKFEKGFKSGKFIFLFRYGRFFLAFFKMNWPFSWQVNR